MEIGVIIAIGVIVFVIWAAREQAKDEEREQNDILADD